MDRFEFLRTFGNFYAEDESRFEATAVVFEPEMQVYGIVEYGGWFIVTEAYAKHVIEHGYDNKFVGQVFPEEKA